MVLDSDRERQPPAEATPLLKLLSEVLPTDEQPEGTEESGEAGQRHLLPASAMSNENAALRSRAESFGTAEIRPIAKRDEVEIRNR